MGGPTGWWTRDISARPSDAVESSWSDIVEETPDPHGKCWVTGVQAEKLLAREQKIDPLKAIGSYAGAMGAPQERARTAPAC